ncbi:LysE family transporter [Brevibacillus humidisoli]|uniref:LysE family translocator n=1 Tax=Brevibacillus humidisoli TaxID=2895522 RepID=UPI001E4F4F5C|nr:LysE family transporter [Brevibacillus humidisoli]UFJ41264.1 LysE family transporter [Brevibacillus humidisoli]
MTELIAVALITVLATISPGPDFAMVTRNSYLYGRKPGLLAALGIALGVQLHVFYTVLGVGVIISQSVALFTLIKVVGAIYLIYMGWKTFFNRSKLTIDLQGSSTASAFSSFRTGFLTNALNPKTTLFVVSTYTQVVGPDTPLSTQFAYGLFISLVHLVWFGTVAVFFSQERFRVKMIQYQHIVDKLIGTVLVGLGISLSFANIPH